MVVFRGAAKSWPWWTAGRPLNGSKRTPKPEVVRAWVGRLNGRPPAASGRGRISFRLVAAGRVGGARPGDGGAAGGGGRGERGGGVQPRQREGEPPPFRAGLGEVLSPV